MTTEQDVTPSEASDIPAEDLSDELAKKYDPERLLKIMSKRAGRGESLDHSIRNKYEQRFGVDLGHVRLITGEFAEEFNKQRNAHAVTIGTTGMILMGGSPDRSMTSSAGQALLAHELTHVAQAQRGLHNRDQQMPFGGEHSEIEAEAHHEEAVEQQGAGAAAMNKHGEAQAREKQAAKNIEKITKRVLEMFADCVRTQRIRNRGE